MKITRITIDNFKNYLDKRVEVEICCYAYGMTYPDHNILIGMNEDFYYFKTDEGEIWHWKTKDDEGKSGCSINVWDYDEFIKYYEEEAKKLDK